MTLTDALVWASRLAYGWMTPSLDSVAVRSIRDLCRAEGEQRGLDPNWMLSIIAWETGGTFNPSLVNNIGPDAKRGGAYGLGQITIRTAREHGFDGLPDDLLDAPVNIHWMAIILDAGKPQSLQDACAWWNAGYKRFASLPDDHVTRLRYVPHVLEWYARILSNGGQV